MSDHSGSLPFRRAGYETSQLGGMTIMNYPEGKQEQVQNTIK